jgi:hypothetical protein
MAAPSQQGSRRNRPREAAEPGLARQLPTTAHGVVASLALPAPRQASPEPASPLTLPSLHRLPRDASMLYEIGCVDDSGRVYCSEIISRLDWRPGTRLDVILAPRAIVIRAAPGGLTSAQRRPCVLLPSHARNPHEIKAGDHVLLAAAPEHGLLLVYPLAALDDMISRYHSPRQEANQ